MNRSREKDLPPSIDGATVRENTVYLKFADMVEPVPDDEDAHPSRNHNDDSAAVVVESATAKNTKRQLQRLSEQEKRLLAAIDNEDPLKVVGGVRSVASARATVRPPSATNTTTSARPSSAGRGGVVSINIPKALRGVIGLSKLNTPETKLAEDPLPPASAVVPKQPSPPPKANTPRGAVTPRPPSAQVQQRDKETLELPSSRPPTAPQQRPTTAQQRLEICKFDTETPTPSERIARNELGVIFRTQYQQQQTPSRLVRHTFWRGPAPVPPTKPIVHNGQLGVDPHMSHFLDANTYCPMQDHIVPVGASTHARYVIQKQSGGEYKEVMRACRIVAYHPECNTYTIEWHHDQKRKVVKPLAVMLPHESGQEYLQRVERAEEQRDNDEAVIRFTQYAKQRFEKDVIPHPMSQLARITPMVASAFEERYLPLINRCIDEVEAQWNTSIRESIARYHLQSRAERAKVEELRLPHYRRPTPQEVLERPATVDVHDESYHGPKYTRKNFLAAKAVLERDLFVANESLYVTTRFAVQRWAAFEGNLLVDTNIEKLHPPLEVVEFKKHQSIHNTTVVKSLEKEWISSIAQALQTELEGTFDFLIVSVPVYQQSRMARYLRGINLLLAGQLQGLIYRSLEAARKFFASLRVDAETLQAVRDEAQGGTSRKSSAFLKLVGCYGTKSVVEPPFARTDAGQQVVPDEPFGVPMSLVVGIAGVVRGIQPILVCRVTVEARFKKIICLPSLDEVEDAIREMFSVMLENTDALSGVGPQLFPMLNLRPSNLTEHARSVRSSDEHVVACESELAAMLEENLSGPKAVLNLYQPFAYLLAQSTEGFIQTFKKGGRRSVDDFDEVCDRLSQHIIMIEQRSLNDVVFPLLRVDCHGIKQALTAKAKDILHTMLTELVSIANEHIDDIDAKYCFIYERVQREPQTPEELQELRTFVDSVPHKMAELQHTFDIITAEIQLLSKYGYMPEQQAFEKYWNSYSWPRKISVVMDDVPFHLQMFRAQFLAQTHETTNKLQEAIQDCARAVNILSYEENEAMVDDVVRRVGAIDETLQRLKNESALANTHEQIFQQPITKWPMLKDIEKQFVPLAALWRVTADSREVEHWAELSMERLDPQEITSLHGSWLKEINRLGKILLHEIPYSVVKSVKEKLETFKAVLPVITALAKPSLLNRRRHVARIAEMLNANNKSFALNEKTPNELLRLGILSHMTLISEISENADHEFKLETQLSSMREEWQKVNFTLQPYMDTYLLKDTDEIRNLADEHVIKTQTMLASPYAAAIAQELNPWEERVSLISRTLDAWLQCQYGFRYLSPMFTQSEDIAYALPDEAKSFDVVYSLWRVVMDSVSKVPSVVIRCSEVKLLEQFLEANTRLDKIMKEICRYLDQKREAFPRFYFLSNEDLIEILSRSREPLRIQPFIQKCFEGIHHLSMDDSEDHEITEMVSSEGEAVGLFEPVFPTQFDNVVDKWLQKLEQIMYKTIQNMIEKSLASSRTMSRKEWVSVWPGQVCIAASQILWTVEAEDSIMKNGLSAFVRRVHQQVRELALLVREQLSHAEMCTLQALIVILVHAKDVSDALQHNRVSKIDEFLWVSQLRYYWDVREKKTTVRQTIATLPYGCEYLGNSSRLVITPLTDRCYRTLTAAYHLNFGGAPEGPAGTGKTETTKDLAKAIAKMCVVFNCSDQIKAFEMEKLLRGLAATGSWGCFDEFNRIEVQVLSVIAQQVLTIQLAVAQKRPQFLFEDRLCTLREGCSVFITMNPGYAGRTELPDNLKALFRPVAMMVPDYAFIAENSLYSCGFLEATVLAKKIVAAYKLSSEQLSSQSHYDFGMRAVKSVLSAAQSLRQQSPSEPEAHIVMRAIINVNRPKFLANDALLFDGVVHDLFGKPNLTEVKYPYLDAGIRIAADKENLQLPQFFLAKIRQLYELVKVRHGVMVVGQSVSGKSAALQALASGLTWAYSEHGENEACTIHALNPKSVSLAQLYGHNDASGAEWYDGILSNIFRDCAASTDRRMRHWITLDGPVDSIWIENMNTVLDDNKKLCLTNGDMIRMTEQMTMVFVVQDLFAASPATVSRCGMVYFEPQELGWLPLYESWKKTITWELENSSVFWNTTDLMVRTLLPPALKFVSSTCILATPHTQQMMAHQFFRFYHHMLEELLRDDDRIPATSDADMQMYCEGILLFVLTWSVGGLLNASDRVKFDAWLRSHLDMDGRKADAYRTSLPVPEHGSIFQYKIEIPKEYAGRPAWTDWLLSVAEVPIETLVEDPFQEITVPTNDTASLSYLFSVLLRRREPILVVGPTATGKTMLVKQVLKQQQHVIDCFSCHIQFSAQTSARDLQVQLERRLERRGQRRYGPPLGKCMIAFIDDLGMPEADAYGTQTPIELVRQLLVQGGLYSTSRAEFGFRHIQQLYFAAATQPAGTGRSMVSNRLLRHFLSFYIPAATPETMKRIFSRLYDWVMGQPNINPTLRILKESLVGFTVDVYSAVSDALLPSPAKCHYLFNLRDLSRVWLGVSGMHGPTTRDDTALITLVVHECFRVFGDRLVDRSDEQIFERILDEKLQHFFKRSLGGITHASSSSSKAGESKLLYTNFLVDDKTSGAASHIEADRLYLRVPDEPVDFGEKILRKHVDEMQQTSRSASDIVVFGYLVHHVARIARIIQQPSGSVLLMGLGGTGRRSAAAIAAHVCGFSTKTIRASSKYTRDSWTEDVVIAMRQSGERGISLLFMLSDTDIKEDSFLEDVCSLLNTGDVPGLLDSDTQDAIAHSLKNVAKDMGREYGRDGCMELFVQRVRQNLHFALCFSPAGDAMRNRLRRFPSLVNCTTMNWMPPWPSSALSTVASAKLASLNGVLSEAEIRVAGQFLLQTYEDTLHLTDSGRALKTLPISMFITPTAFLDLIEAFVQLMVRKQQEIQNQKQRYTGGLDVIRSTEVSVAEMQKTLEVNRPKLVEKTAQVAELIAQIDAAQAIAKEERDLVAVEEAQANRIAESAKAVFDDCEANLAIALPAMQAATDAVSQMDKKQLVELRSLANPSDKIKKVIEAVCIVLEVKPKEVLNPKTQKKELDYWTPTKTKVMAEVETFRDTLINYDKDNMKADIFEVKIQPFIRDKTFRPEAVKDVSQALVGVTQWVIAMETYYRVRKVVKPKQEKLAAAQAELEACQSVLNEKKKLLADIDERLAVMTAELQSNIAEKEMLEQAQHDTEVKLDRAVRLFVGLADEKTRYAEQVVVLNKRRTTLFADCLYAAAAQSNLGPLPQEERLSLRARWADALRFHMNDLRHVGQALGYGDRTFNELLSTPVEELNWKMHGLPLDGFSVDSAIIAQSSKKAPFLVDPQGQAVAWLRHMLPNMTVVKHDSDTLHSKLKEAVVSGLTVLVEDCPADIDPFLYPILDREVSVYNGAKIIALGDNTVAFHDKVRVVLATKLAHPAILPSTSARVTVVQFSITESGLTEQLLQRVIAHEDRDQEEKRNRVVEQQASCQEQLILLEDALLTMLASGRDLLADEVMCEQLDTAKRTSQTLMARLADADAFQKSFEKIRQRYMTIATKSSSLFFAVASLPAISNMYEFSLAWFTALLLKALERPHEEGESRSERCQLVLNLFYKLLFANVSKGLFAKDKVAFTVMMLLRILGTPDQEASIFISGPLDVPLSDEDKSIPKPDFLSAQAWTALLQASRQLPSPLSSMAAIVRSNYQDFFCRYCTEELEHRDEEHAPMFDAAFGTVLTPVQRLMIVRFITPRFLMSAITQVVDVTLGREFTQPAPFDLDRIMKEQKDPTVPLIFVLAPGGDPLTAIRRFAEVSLMTSNLDTLSLGSGMEHRAVQLITKGTQQGRWVVLQNCHLYPDWMPELDGIVEALSHRRVETNNSFRLVLTTTPTASFPQNLLQRGTKVVMEPPQGIRANLAKLLSTNPMTDPLFFESSKNPSVFKRLAFSLCVFHSVVQERRSFGPIGWNIPYEFTDTDLRISLLALQVFVDKAAEALIKEGVSLSVPTALPVVSATTSSTLQVPSSSKAQSVKILSDEELTSGLSYDALQYLIGECNYGGRVTDVHDRRLLLDILREFVGPRLFDDEDPMLPVPLNGDIAVYQAFVGTAEAQISGPEMLGLDSNALIVRSERQATQLLLQLALTSHKAPTTATDSSSAQSTEAMLEVVIRGMLDMLPPPFNVSDVEDKYPPSDYLNSLNSVLVQELQRYNRLTHRIRSTLKELLRALKGEAVLTTYLNRIAEELMMSTTPSAWKAVCYPSLKPAGSFVADLRRRLDFFQQWIDYGPQAVCWIGGLFFPQSFITGTLQNYCRRTQVTIDELSWRVVVLAANVTPSTSPAAGCYLSGIFLEGCRWDSVGETLANALPKALQDNMPIVHLVPCIHAIKQDEFDMDEEVEELDDGGNELDDMGDNENEANASEAQVGSGSEQPHYRCPVYRTQDRHGVLMTTGHSTNFLMYLDLPIPAYTKPSTWVRRGVAAFTTSSQ